MAQCLASWTADDVFWIGALPTYLRCALQQLQEKHPVLLFTQEYIDRMFWRLDWWGSLRKYWEGEGRGDRSAVTIKLSRVVILLVTSCYTNLC